MKFFIISDIHDNLVNLEKCLNWRKSQDINRVICCGDLANSDTLAYLARNFRLIYLVRGNLEIYNEAEVSQYDNITYLGRWGMFEIDGKAVGLCHEPRHIKEVLKIKVCQLVFYGHTHKPWIEERHGLVMANPGTLAGQFNKATFAVWDSEINTLELKILELL